MASSLHEDFAELRAAWQDLCRVFVDELDASIGIRRYFLVYAAVSTALIWGLLLYVIVMDL